MSRRKRTYADDDGRVIADMSGVGRNADKLEPLSVPNTTQISEDDLSKPTREAPPFTRQERRMYAFAALRAALLIGLAFLAGLGLVIWLITLL